MTETNNDNRIHELKREIVLRTLHPEALDDYRPENERSTHIDQLKDELQSLGVDANIFHERAIVQNLGIQSVGEVIKIDFPRKAS